VYTRVHGPNIVSKVTSIHKKEVVILDCFFFVSLVFSIFLAYSTQSAVSSAERCKNTRTVTVDITAVDNEISLFAKRA